MDPSASLLGLRFVLASSVRIRSDDKIAFEPRSGCIAKLNDLGFILMKAAEASLPVAASVEAMAGELSLNLGPVRHQDLAIALSELGGTVCRTQISARQKRFPAANRPPTKTGVRYPA